MISELYKNACALMPGGVNSPVRSFKAVNIDPLFVERAQGSAVYSPDGKQYLDFCMSWGAVILGHNSDEVRAAVIDAAQRGTSFGFCHKDEARLAELIVRCFPSIEKIRFVNSGTEAVMSALRLARAFTGRRLVVKFDGCYHGHGDAMLVSAGSGVGEITNASSRGVTEGTARDTISIPYNDFEAVKKIFQGKGADIACIIVEPVAGNMGLVPPEKNYLQFLRDITRQYKSLLVFDEVITGFRVAAGGVQTIERITPDITTLGKIIGGGLPVGAFGGRAEIMNLLAPLGGVYQAGTLSGNPLSMNAGIAVLTKLISAPEIYEHMISLVNIIADNLKTRTDITVNTYKTLFTIFFSKDPIRNFTDVQRQDNERFVSVYKSLFDNGILLPPSPYETSFLSAVHTTSDVERLLSFLD